MTPIEVLKMLKSKIDEAEFYKSNYVLQSNDVKAINQALHIHDVVGRSEQLSCGRNITTCVFYKEGGKCSNLEYCRDQTT